MKRSSLTPLTGHQVRVTFTTRPPEPYLTDTIEGVAEVTHDRFIVRSRYLHHYAEHRLSYRTLDEVLNLDAAPAEQPQPQSEPAAPAVTPAQPTLTPAPVRAWLIRGDSRRIAYSYRLTSGSDHLGRRDVAPGEPGYDQLRGLLPTVDAARLARKEAAAGLLALTP